MDTRAHRLLSEIPCQYVKGVGPKVATLLEKCNVFTVQDILFHLPYRYQDRTRITPIRQARAGDWVVIEGMISDIQIIKRPRSPSQFVYILSDTTGSIQIRFFHLMLNQQEQLQKNTCIRVFGEIRFGRQGLNLIHPEYQLMDSNHPILPDKTLTPIYSSTDGLSQYHWRKITDHALGLLTPHSLENYLPDLDLANTLRQLHRPEINTPVDNLKKRLAFEELLAHHLSLRQKREKNKLNTGPIFNVTKINKTHNLNIDFKLTHAQERVLSDITQDLHHPYPMMRLIQGDVGSGKTIVAALTALIAIQNNYQVALMAPTELLADQHYKNFQYWFKDLSLGLDLNILLLKSKQSKKIINTMQEIVKNNNHVIAIGTHALFQESVSFKNLGLVIIDEQHRFGVEQRLALQKKGVVIPHQLVMTATPIPRTLAMTLYADLAVSIIDELPPGRTPVKTVIVNHQRRSDIIERIKLAHHEKRQIYWVCPLIEESDILQYRAAETTATLLHENLPDLKIGLIHGKLKSTDKEMIMADFKAGKIDLLVATTVIEVGVDVPNASVMIIENAERLGLAQLHQLRGRVGRGSKESFCLLLYQEPLSRLAQERLKIMRESQDGFVIAEKDLELRGPGEFLGTRQTGDMDLKMADLQRDKDLFNAIQKTADTLIADKNKNPNNNTISLIIRRWLGNSADFSGV